MSMFGQLLLFWFMAAGIPVMTIVYVLHEFRSSNKRAMSLYEQVRGELEACRQRELGIRRELEDCRQISHDLEARIATLELTQPRASDI